jgi:hypothetical protein
MGQNCHVDPLCRIVSVLFTGTSSAVEAADEPAFGIQAGQEVAFLVIDFCHGQHECGGVPTVMIANDDARGILLIAREPTEDAIGGSHVE